ncbi:MAG: phosphodiester glycosidase family protein [Bacteroidales bacterium]|nr:phosphodiester glycosidase family protein [Bacteroidales bacterium]
MKIFVMIVAAAILAMSCEDKQDSSYDWPFNDPVQNDPEVQEPEEPEVGGAALDKWTEVSSDFGTLPEYVKVYKSPDSLEGKKAIAYVAVADMSKAQWDIWSIDDSDMAGTTDSFKTPATVYKEGKWSVVINAGFFYASGGMNYSSSLAVRESEVLAYNINYAAIDWSKPLYHPTRAAFLESAEGDFDACWTYKTTSTAHYMYTSPALNSWENKPAATPSASYPEGAKKFAAKTAIGGGPLLIDNGKFKDTYVEELFNGSAGIGPDTNQPRTAIGVTEDDKMILFVCEGRQMTEGVKGLTTADVANVLLDLGCVEAINLDGGGSSCMLINGKPTIKVSDGSQRAVGSTVMIK